MAAQAEVHPIVATLVGPGGLALEVFGRLLADQGIVVLGEDSRDGLEPDVAVLIEPLAEHWAGMQARGLPIVLVLDEEAADAVVLDAVLAGADAVLNFTTPPSAIRSVLMAVGRGGSVLEPIQTRAVASLARHAASHPGVVLSRREGEILASIAAGQAVKQTARALGISPKTVENLQGRLFRKLAVRNRAQAVARAHGLGLL
jgi:DNA-binding NarL/FixJ family response regulator